MNVNHAAFEEGMRHQRVTSYTIMPRQASEQVGYQVFVENIPSLFEEDLRMIQNKEEMPFWVQERGNAGAKLAKLKVNSPQQLFALCGNPSAKTESNGNATFEFFDDFAPENVSVSWANISTDVYGNGVYVPQGPTGIYVSAQNKTYIIWQTLACGRKIVEFNHTSHSLQNETEIGGSHLTENGHGGPALGIDNDGYLYVFYGSHSSIQYYKKSTNVYDITSWGIQQTLVSESTYPQPFYTDNKFWVFYRDSAKEWVYKTTSDGGSNWSATTEITNFSGLENMWGVYARTMKAPNGDLHIAWIWRDTAQNYYNLYYAYLDISAGQWKKRDGTVLTLPIIEAAADKVFTGSDTWIWGLDVDSNNEPYILFAYSGDNKIKLAKWKNSAWNIYDAISYPFQPSCSFGAFKVDSALNMRVLMTSTDEKTARLYKSTDGGESWAFDKVVGEEMRGKSYKYGAGFQTVFNANSKLEFIFGPSVWPGAGGIAAAWGEGYDFAHTETIEYVLSDKWTTLEGTPAVISEELHLDSDDRVESKTVTGSTCAIRYSATHPNETGSSCYGLAGLYDNVDKECLFLTQFNWDVRSRDGGNNEITTIGAYSGKHVFDVKKKADIEAKYYVDNVLKDTDTAYVPSAALPILFYKKDVNDLIIHWVLARKYAAPEPLIIKKRTSGKADVIKAIVSGLVP